MKTVNGKMGRELLQAVWEEQTLSAAAMIRDMSKHLISLDWQDEVSYLVILYRFSINIVLAFFFLLTAFLLQDGMTALDLAAVLNLASVSALLIKEGADVHIRNNVSDSCFSHTHHLPYSFVQWIFF